MLLDSLYATYNISKLHAHPLDLIYKIALTPSQSIVQSVVIAYCTDIPTYVSDGITRKLCLEDTGDAPMP